MGRPQKYNTSNARLKAHRKKQDQHGKRSEIFLNHQENRTLEALVQTWGSHKSQVLARLLQQHTKTAITPPFPTNRTIKHVVSISGGKDSLATLLLAKERLGENFTAIFCDTGNEHPETYDYINYLHQKIHPIEHYKADFSQAIQRKRKFIKTQWTKQGIDKTIINNALSVLEPTGNPFLDLCLWKGRFPSTRARFCTQELKRKVSENQVISPLVKKGFAVCLWVGIRADESTERAKLKTWHKQDEHVFIYRPILKWSADRVFRLHEEYNIKPNPLYKKGCKRVGCMPCIHSGKDELMNIANRFPEVIERLKKWERIASKASKRGMTTFFSFGKIPESVGDLKKPDPERLPTIDRVVNWSRTGKGGRVPDNSRLPQENSVCTSVYGLCD